MKKMSRKFWVIAVIALLLAALVPTIASAEQAQPSTLTGNPTCGSVGLPFGAKWDNPGLAPTTLTTQFGTITITPSAVNNDGSQPRSFSWTSTFGIDSVLVKAGRGANVYTYSNGTSGEGLVAFQGRGVSHISFCFDTPTVPTPTPTSPRS
ncbi:MAG: hypothetical protein ACRC1H_17260 [Caldilineaceae bacterium]